MFAKHTFSSGTLRAAYTAPAGKTYRPQSASAHLPLQSHPYSVLSLFRFQDHECLSVPCGGVTYIHGGESHKRGCRICPCGCGTPLYECSSDAYEYSTPLYECGSDPYEYSPHLYEYSTPLYEYSVHPYESGTHTKKNDTHTCEYGTHTKKNDTHTCGCDIHTRKNDAHTPKKGSHTCANGAYVTVKGMDNPCKTRNLQRRNTEQ